LKKNRGGEKKCGYRSKFKISKVKIQLLKLDMWQKICEKVYKKSLMNKKIKNTKKLLKVKKSQNFRNFKKS